MNARRGMWRTERPARGRIAIGKAALAVCALTMACLCHAAILDSIRFGDAGSERAHAFSGEETLVVAKNSSGPRGRRIRKPKEDSWQSAPMSFRLKVDPHEKNYITVKFWGGDVTHDHLVMFIDGKQMGYMHLGDYDILDYEQCEPRDAPRSANPSPQYAGRFTYTTFLLPEAATKGKRSIDVAIRATGKIWGYGNNFGQFQKNVTQDSRRICSVHIHSQPYFAPDETNEPPPTPPSAEIPDVDLDAVKSRVDEELKRAMNADPTRDPDRLVFLAEAYHVEWCAAYRNPKVVRFALAAIDDLARRYASEPEKVVQRGSWSNCERQATALILLESALRPHFDEAIDDGRGDLVPRRELWCDMFEAAAFQLARDRRWLANQSQIVDNSGHRCNRATHILDDRRGLPLSVTLRFLKESLGILPWSHGINPDLSVSDPRNTPGKNYFQLTKKFLSKEWGYVGSYGESTIWASAMIYEATIDRRTGEGDREIFNVMKNAAIARTIFRYPGVTADNRPVMRLEVYIDWRNAHFPGEPAYVASGLDLRTLHYAGTRHLFSCFKAMLEDGVFQARLANALKTGRPDWVQLLHLPDRYAEILQKLDGVEASMPMRGKDFVFADEEIGVVALKNGDDVLFAELYWRAKRGINNLAKIHYLTPLSEHVATIHQEEEFIPNGEFSTEPDWVVYGFRPNRFDYPGGYYEQLRAGQRIPQAEHASDVTYIGKAEFYRCSYGRYEIAMNATRLNKSYSFRLPQGEWRLLPNGPNIKGDRELTVQPNATLVFFRLK